MKEIQMPENFDGQKYFDLYGEYPTSHKEGWLRVPDEIENVDDCVTTQEDFQNQKISRLWESAHTYALNAVDTDARFKYLAMLQDESVSLQRKTKIRQNYAWIDQIWAGYAGRKQLVLEGNLSVSEDFSNYGEAPYSFWEIVS